VVRVVFFLILSLMITSLAYADVSFGEVRAAMLKQSVHDSSEVLLNEYEGKIVSGSAYIIQVFRYSKPTRAVVLLSEKYSRISASASVSINIPATSLFYDRAMRLNSGEKVFFSGKIVDFYEGKIFLDGDIKLN